MAAKSSACPAFVGFVPAGQVQDATAAVCDEEVRIPAASRSAGGH
jgi:hypothetical protein